MGKYQTNCFINRELSWLRFNERVLAEACDPETLLFERLKFLSITESNLDEFFMIRFASLKDMVNAGYEKADFAGLTPQDQIDALTEEVHEFKNQQYAAWNRSLQPLLLTSGLHFIRRHEDMTPMQEEFADRFFMEEVYPALTPMAVDSSRPFPLIRNKSLNIGALLHKKDDADAEVEFATVQVPSVIPRVVKLPKSLDGTKNIILLEEIIERNMDKLFLSYDILCAHPYRVMRNADLSIDEDEADDLLQEIEKQIRQRQWGEVIRLDVERGMDPELFKMLRKEFHISKEACYEIPGALDLTFLMKVYALKGFDKLKENSYKPVPVPGLEPGSDIFAEIRKRDILLALPFQSFGPVIDFVKKAAHDPQVLAIKQTLYRVSGNSPVIAALAEAAENGKQVTVLVELKARFDEENNIVWAKKLEKAGCHVIYGLVGLKTHCKITLVVRREDDGIRRYVHLGTGNYNDSTAKQYTDMGVFTCSVPIGQDATAVFNMLSGYSEPAGWNRLSLAPIWLRDRFLGLIRREKENVERGGSGHIIAKMNSLCDKGIIEALYDASKAGVKIELIVRGICCLIPGVSGFSENITVRSIVGTFLEHSRIFLFHNNGEEEIFMGSADWMPRNLDRRVEILFPVEREELKDQIREFLRIQLADTIKASEMQSDGTYKKVDRRGKPALNSQLYFCDWAKKLLESEEDAQESRLFIPREHPDVFAFEEDEPD